MPSEGKPHTAVVISDINAPHSASKDTVLDNADTALAEKNEDKNASTNKNDPVEPVESTPVVRKRINRNNPLYEVIVDTWGSKPAYHRGTLIRKNDCLNNIERGLEKGVIKLVREYDTPEVD